MAEAFLLPCGCGKKIRVGTAQAGQSVSCPCGQSVGVPTLRGLRELERAPAEEMPAGMRPRAAWSPWHGAAFSGGLIVAAIALLLALINFWYFGGARFFSTDRSDTVIEVATEEVDKYTPEQMLAEWNTVVQEGLGHAQPPFWVAAQESAKVYRWRTIAFACLSVTGLLVAIGAVFFGRR
jgi:hypothetical protein